MIVTFDDLVAYSKRMANQYPDLRQETEIRRPGCTEDEINEMAHDLPLIPCEYLDVVRELDIVGVFIGFFQLSPHSATRLGLPHALREENNSEIYPVAANARRQDLYLIGSWEAEPIGVVKSNGGCFPGGTVVMLSHDVTSAAPVPLAKCFRDFLLTAGNLDMVRGMEIDAQGPNGSLALFEAYLQRVPPNRSSEMIRHWRMIAEIVLS